MSQQQAAQAASGLNVNSGSNLDVTDSTRALGNLSFGNIRDNTARETYGYRGQATNFANQAALAKASAPTLFSSLLGAASAVGGTYAGIPVSVRMRSLISMILIKSHRYFKE